MSKTKPTLVKTILSTKASVKLAVEVEKDLEVEDPSPEKARASINKK